MAGRRLAGSSPVRVGRITAAARNMANLIKAPIMLCLSVTVETGQQPVLRPAAGACMNNSYP